MTISSEKNLYPGVNPHLNSFLQSEDGGWESFHSRYVDNIATELDRQLPSNYYAVGEKSLQISEIGIGSERHKRTRPDISIYNIKRSTHPSPSPTLAASPTLTLPLATILEDEDDYLSAVLIYEIVSGKVPGKPVTRIEVLSPANKPPQSYYRQYMARRLQTLRSGLSLVEIDYLHEQHPVIDAIPSYLDREKDSFPYHITVSDPHPIPEEGQFEVYAWGIDSVIPKICIPLLGSDTVTIDFGAIYNYVFEVTRLFHIVVDYQQEPERFDRYSPEDQGAIRKRMQFIRDEYGKQP